MLGGTPDPWPEALVSTQTLCSHLRCAAWGDGAGLALATPASDPCSERSTSWAGLTFDWFSRPENDAAGATPGLGALKAVLPSPHPHPAQTHSALSNDMFSLRSPPLPSSGAGGAETGKDLQKRPPAGPRPGGTPAFAYSLGLGAQPRDKEARAGGHS